ncbi:hypothetical protein LuPra_04295 [Luteitalea pratensis]|uniref:Uncharacterized protein n=1 Tax=Luteitalea pratensis TaxID=1855912 RepID=A0A143PRL8_LUTPR|nr:hypothetical protein [Luteitalea pratensis]AMY11051.1 hypothetical protein LuPra_04295 [Luteitalea pratensis]
MSWITAAERGWKLRVAVVVILIGGLGAGVAARQNPGGVIELLEQILASLTTVQEGVDGLIAANDSNVAFTPMVELRSGVLYCGVVNIADSTRSVEIEVFNTVTGELTADGSAPALEPRRSHTTAFVPASLFPGSYYCKVAVLDGKSQDIRGALLIKPAQDATTALVAAAQ